MNLEQYRLKKRAREQSEPVYRSSCAACTRPPAECYCALIHRFDSDPQFVILMNEEEKKRGIATGRMAHLCLSNSYLFEGRDFTRNAGVNALIADEDNHCVLLHLNHRSTNLTLLDPADRVKAFPKGKRLVVFILDGTWGEVKKMRRLSTNLHGLQTICFTPSTPSAFHVRKQPHKNCYSSIEAIHHLIGLLDPAPSVDRDSLLNVFHAMVARQLSYRARDFRPQYRPTNAPAKSEVQSQMSAVLSK